MHIPIQYSFAIAMPKTAPLAVFPMNSYFRSKSVEHDVTLTSFVAERSHHGLSTFNIMCDIDAIEGNQRLMVIRAFV